MIVKHSLSFIRYNTSISSMKYKVKSLSDNLIPAGRLSFSRYGSWESALAMLFLLFEHQYIKKIDMHKVLGSGFADITCDPISVHLLQVSRFVVN